MITIRYKQSLVFLSRNLEDLKNHIQETATCKLVCPSINVT